MGIVTQFGKGYSAITASDQQYLMYRAGQRVGVGPGIICLHGRGASAVQYAPNSARDYSPGFYANALAREGFRVMSIDDNGTTDWGSQDSTDRINEAITYLQDVAKGGAKSGKVGIMGWSMGGMATLNWLDQNIAKHACSWLWAPASDLEYFHNNATYTAEIDAAYAQEGNRVGNSPIAQAANYRGAGPIRIVHAVDDTTIPIQQSRDFVTAVGDPGVTLFEAPVGNHTAMFGQVTELEVVKFYRDNLGVPGL